MSLAPGSPEVVVRPDSRGYLHTVLRPGRLLLPVVMIVLLGVVVSGYQRSLGPALIAALGYAFFAWAAGYQVLYLRNARVVATAHQLAWRGGWRAGRTVTRDRLGKVVERQVRSTRYARPRIMILDSDGAIVFELSPSLWDRNELDAAWTILALPVDTDERVISAAELRRQYPRTTAWLTAHSDLVGWLVVGTLLVVAGVLSVVNGESPF